MEHANGFPNFLRFPTDSVLHPGFWNISCGVILYHREGFQLLRCPPVIKNIGHVKRKFHEDIGGMRCGPARRWVQTQLDVRKTSGKRWLRFFIGKRILRAVLSEEFREWDANKFADGLVLRSWRAVPGVWRLLVWEQAEEINAERFSCLGSWRFGTRIPQRTHTQLYGVWYLGEYSSSQGAAWAVGRIGGALSERQCATETFSWQTIVKPTRRGACVDRQELFLYLTSQLLQDKQTWTFWPGLQERCLYTSPHPVYFGPSWLDTCWIPSGWGRSSCLPVSTGQIQVFPGLWSSSVLQSWALLCEKGD